jgi:segregation and condensation protein B
MANEVPVHPDRALEAILLVADEPQPLGRLAATIGEPVAAIRDALDRLVSEYDAAARGFELREVGGGWRFYVREAYDEIVSEFVSTQASTRLSPAALETLAVVAYKQPISRGQIAAIRAVNVDSVMRTLVARGLVAEMSTDPETGAITYGTTELFLAQLGVNSHDELPPITPLLDGGADGFDSDLG